MNNKSQTLKETFSQALQSYKKKDYKNAEFLCYKIINIDPNHVDSLLLLATICAVHKNFVKAKELMERAVEIQPGNIIFLSNLGTTNRELGNLKEAINIYKKVLKINPNHTNSNYNLGLVYHSLRELKKAKNYLQKTTEIQKNFALAFFNLGNVHFELKEFKEALSCYQKTIEINPNIVSAYNNLGLLYRDLNDFQNAISCYQKAIKIKSNYASSHHNLALAYKEIGEFGNSIKSHQMAIKSEPENLMNYHFLSELKKDILNSQLKNKVEKILSSEKQSINNLAYGNYILAKYERKIKHYEKELNYLIKGHKYFFNFNKKKFDLNIKYCFDDVHEIIKGGKIDKSYEKNNTEIKPIFIIGVPRCGSTLVERIIGSGKKFIPVGEETGVMGNFLPAKILERQSLNLGSLADIREELFNVYKEKGLLMKKYDYTFTDKSLDNFFYLELIKEIYPNAKIINCKRDNLSSIVSIFQNNLTTLAWTHDLDNIFKYFDNYLKIIEKYNKTYPNILYQLEFEKLINNPEKESKKLMKYCELPWDKNFLEFYKRKDLVSKTASNIQIRKPIYKHSIDKYLPYKKFLDKYSKNYSWFN